MQSGSNYYGQSYHNEEEYNPSYGHNYRNYRMMNEPGIKGKIEQKYWKSKQKVIEKFGKDQDEFVIAGDAEVDARLEAFQHIKITCMQLMAAIDCYQSKIFSLSQDENDMGRFLRDQGATDKTKAGKMMIAVGKAQSFAAQQRLSLRSSLARLYAEIETFRFRAIQDTQITVTKMEQARTDYRAGLLWMSDISKELDPDQFKRLDKFRDVQSQVKATKKQFDKLKGDVCQKIDLLSASRCNLLSATLEPYQSAMVKFLGSTAKSYNSVSEQYKGHPSYQFNILKHIIPNNGIVDEDDDDDFLRDTEEKSKKTRKQKSSAEKGVEATEKENDDKNKTDDDDDSGDAKLISFDSSPSEESKIDDLLNDKKEAPSTVQKDLLGAISSSEDNSPGFGSYTAEDRQKNDEFQNMLGQFQENNLLADTNGSSASGVDSTDPFSYISGLDAQLRRNSFGKEGTNATEGPGTSVDDLLFGSPTHKMDGTEKTNTDILSDALFDQSLGITAAEQANSFTDQWQSMFGDTSNENAPITAASCSNDASLLMQPTEDDTLGNLNSDGVDAGVKSQRMFLPSFLLEEMRRKDPIALKHGPPKGFNSVEDSISPQAPRKNKKGDGKDMSAWFNLFADLDPLANPDDIGASLESAQEKQAC